MTGPAGPDGGAATERPGPVGTDLGPPSAGDVEAAVFGAALPAAQRYVDLLASDGVAHGHVGPREVPRLWSRHLVNSAAVTELVPTGVTVVDVGSGAGLPGLPIALRRPDLRLVLVEPMQKRVDFLTRVVGELALDDRVSVVRGRAEDPHVVGTAGSADVVTARAVARLDRLVRWCLPLLAPSGTMLALKGRSAPDELAEVRPALRRLRATDLDVHELVAAPGADPTWVVSAHRAATRPRTRRPGR